LLVRALSLFILPPWRGKAFRDSRLKADPFPGFAMTVAALPHLKDVVNTIVLGSSHAHYGYHAEGSVFNLAYTSCDLYHSCGLYEWLDNNGFDKVKNVILFFDVFSPGFELEKTSDSHFHIPFEENFGIAARCPLAGQGWKTERILKARIRHSVCKARRNPDLGWRGNGDYGIVINCSVEHRVAKHLKNCFRGNGQTRYVGEMAKLASRRGDRFVVVIPPLREDYRKLLPPGDVMFDGLYALAKENPWIEVIDLLDDARFCNADFNDMDHLNLHGAKKLARIVEGLMCGGATNGKQ
jgi:hypothetical protein